MMAATVVACESPQPPAACGRVPQVTVNAKESTSVTACFNDPNGDVLSYSATSSNPGVATVSASGPNIAITAVLPGSASITVTAADPGGLQGQLIFQVMVPNRAPQPRGAMPSMTVPVGRSETVDVSSYFTEPDGEGLAYGAASSNGQMATVSVSGSAVIVTAVAKGAVTVTVTARDPGGLTAQQAFLVTVPNRAPVAVGTIADVEVQVDTIATVDVAAHFSDPDGDALTYSAESSSPANARVSVSGSAVAVRGVSKGAAAVTVTARDPGGLTAQQAFLVTVPNRAPAAVGTIADVEVQVDTIATVDVAAHFSDPDGDALTYSAESSSPANARVSVSGSAVAVRGVSAGAAAVTVTARDPGGLTARQTFRVTVPNRAPVAVGTIADVEVQVDTIANIDVAAHFSDPDGDSLAYSATSSSPANARVSVSGSAVAVRGVSAGAATVTVAARDPGGLTARQTFKVRVSNPDRRVLEALYDSLGGDDWIRNTNWKTDAPLNEWYGVMTNQAGRVTALRLNGNGLAGEIPAVVGSLRSLKWWLELGNSGGRITGTIPPELGNLSNLRHLYLAGNSLDGPIPPELGNLSSLEDLLLSDNSLTGPIPSELGNLSNLKELQLGWNFLTGPIPPELGNLSDLWKLWLFDNSLDGPIPPELGNLSSLRQLWLVGNSLTGPIPRELGNLSDLEDLMLNGNPLGGPIPRELGNLSSLKELGLFETSLTGPIPPELGNLSNLEWLVLSGNSLTGPIPRELGNLSNLEALMLSDNSLTGPIPRELGKLGNLEDLHLDRNELSGTIPGELGDLSRLRNLGLYLNELSGGIPPELGDLGNLETLWLYANELTGSLPPELGRLGGLERLRVHANQLEGKVPSTFLKLEDLKLFWFGKNDDLCAPNTSAFTIWLNGMDDWVGERCREREVFDLEMRFTSGASSTVRSHLEEARQEWADILMDTELLDIHINRNVNCGGVTRHIGTVDDHMVWVHVDSIDGKGGILAYAGYCISRTKDGSPVLSRAVFDEDDIDAMLDHDALVPIAFHELAHGLGFSGYHWDKYGLLEKGSDAHFTGELAIEAFDDAGGDDYDGNKVPVQLRVYGHWRESVFGDEMMSTSVSLRDDDLPVSAITLQSMAEIGYEVDLSLADDYELPDPGLPPPAPPGGEDPAVFDLGRDVVWGPVTVVDTDGRVIRVIPPPPGSVRWPLPRRDVRVEPPRPPAGSVIHPRSGPGLK